MTTPEKPLIAIDVDGVLLDFTKEPPVLFPGTKLLLESLHTLGELHLWSAAGRSHAEEVVASNDLDHLIADCHDKPEYPPQEDEAIRILGRKAILQLDDDPTERVADWNFVHVTLLEEL